MRRSCPPGTTLVELMVGLVIAAILGAAVVRGLMSEARISEDREAWANARRVTLSAAGRLASELRMVETGGGVEYANDAGDTLVVRAPYAFGVLCATDGSLSTVALLPADSVMLAAPGFSGFAWRNAETGTYAYVTAGTDIDLEGDPDDCEDNGITPVTGLADSPDGLVIELEGAVPDDLAPGTVIFLFRRVRYVFADSDLVPGQVGLWRTTLSTGATEELAAPFDSTARFRYFVPGEVEAQEDVPGSLAGIRGVEIQLDGRSEMAPRVSESGSRILRMASAIYFQNTTD
ncbi:MAG TPA: type II secretion system protein [Longimicrobiales bacterium]|nr:type II secretion system protein [Longimicrobiales bacterium]